MNQKDINEVDNIDKEDFNNPENDQVTDQNMQDDQTSGQNTEADKSTDVESNDIDENEETKKSSDKDQEKKGFFKKDKKKDKKDELIEELTDKYKRTFAEFDNFRKRSEKEKSAMYEVGARDIIEKILPVVDNFERGLKALSEEDKKTPFAEGMDKIYKQLIKTFDDLGVKEIEALGNEFDPNFHNAVMHIEDEELGENVVAEVLQKGYLYRDTVIRHSMVKVAN